MEYRLSGLPNGTVDSDRQEIRFSLSVSNASRLDFVGKLGVVAQIVAALARMAEELRSKLAAAGAAGAVSAEQVGACQIQRVASDVVLLCLTTPQGVPYSFAIPPQVGADIADQLKTESTKPVGRA